MPPKRPLPPKPKPAPRPIRPEPAPPKVARRPPPKPSIFTQAARAAQRARASIQRAPRPAPRPSRAAADAAVAARADAERRAAAARAAAEARSADIRRRAAAEAERAREAERRRRAVAAQRDRQRQEAARRSREILARQQSERARAAVEAQVRARAAAERASAERQRQVERARQRLDQQRPRQRVTGADLTQAQLAARQAKEDAQRSKGFFGSALAAAQATRKVIARQKEAKLVDGKVVDPTGGSRRVYDFSGTLLIGHGGRNLPKRTAPSCPVPIAAQIDLALSGNPGRVGRLRAQQVIQQNRDRLLRDSQKGGRTVEDVVNLLFDPHHPLFDPNDATHVKIVQNFLRSRGKKIAADGVYGAQTHRALVSEFAAESRAEKQRQQRALVSEFYAYGDLAAGVKAPGWMPTIDGKVPTAQKLLHVLQQGGFTAAVMWTALVKHAREPDVEWLHRRQMMIDALYRRTKGPLPSVTPASELEKMIRITYSPLTATPEGQGQVRAIFRSRSLSDYQRKLRSFVAAEQKAWERQQKANAAKHLHWWQKGLGLVVKAGDAFRVDVMTQYRWAREDPWTYIKGGATKEDRARYKAEAVQQIEQMHGFQRFAFEAIVDPINFIPFGKVGSLAGKAATLGTEAAGRGLIRVAAHEGLDSAASVVLHVTGKRLVQVGEHAFYIPAAKRAAIDGAARFPLTKPIYHGVVKATRTKDAALAVAKGRVMGGLRHGFVEPGKRITAKVVKPAAAAEHTAEGGAAAKAKGAFSRLPGLGGKPVKLPHEHYADFDPGNPAIRAALDETHGEMTTLIPTVLRDLVQSLHQGGAVIWFNAARHADNWTSIGAALRARVAAQSRTIETHKVAATYADDAEQKLLATIEGVELDADGRVIRELIPHTPEARAIEANAREAYIAEYDRVKKAGGVFTRGAGDKEIRGAIDKRVQVMLDKFDHAVLPALQDVLERLAADAGQHLFAVDGSWLHALGEAQDVIRAAARESFDHTITVENPLFGQPMPFWQAKEHIDSEIERRVSRASGFFAREMERGNPEGLPKDWLDAQTAAIEKDVHDAWNPPLQSDDGRILYFDHRQTIEESALYAGHLRESMAVNGRDVYDGTWEAKLRSLAVPSTLGSNTVDREIGELVWHLTGDHPPARYGATAADETARQGVGRFSTTGDRRADWRRFKAAAAKRHIALNDAYVSVFSNALLREGAVWRALVHAQTRPGRILYRALNGHLEMWRTVTLPFNPGWLARNNIDNTAKIFLHGARDPRLYFQPEGLAAKGARPVFEPAAKGARSVFELNVAAMHGFIRAVDRLAGTNAAEPFKALMETVWDHQAATLARIFRVHGIEVPEHVVEQGKQLASRQFDGPSELRLVNQDVAHLRKMGLGEEWIAKAEAHLRLNPAEAEALKSSWQRFKDGVWDFMGTRPEDRARRALYRATYYKERDRLLKHGFAPMDAERHAFNKAVDAVDKVLFDYSKITVLEDNLKIFFPFLQFWRKNTVFWARTFGEKPWLPVEIYKAERQLDDEHADWPEWMRRYVHVEEISDVVARVPGLSWLANVLPKDLMYDPINLFSFAPLYKSFLTDNPQLAPEQRGWAFIGPMVDVIEHSGLGVNPLFRRPLENAGILTEQGWRTIFPQTPLAVALTRKYISDHFAGRVLDVEEMLGSPLGALMRSTGHGKSPSERARENFDYWVNAEIANQIARGEKPDRAKAEQKIQDYFLVQAVVGFFSGSYVRRRTPEDLYLSQLDDRAHRDYSSLDQRERDLVRLWRMKGADPVSVDRYTDSLPLVSTYYRLPDARAREEFLQRHPEILRYVRPGYGDERYPIHYVPRTQLALDSETAIRLSKLQSALKLPQDVRDLAERYLVGPELRKHWDENDTPEEMRRKQVQAAYYGYVSGLNDAYFAIPATDYDARSAFLKEHPDLATFWNSNNSDADDFKLIVQHVLADFRDGYFHLAKKKDWSAAQDWLRRFPWTFDKLHDERYILDRHTGRPATAAFNPASHRGGRHLTPRARDYLAHKRSLDQYFALPKAKRSQWLRSGGAAAKAVLDYFERHARPSATTPKAAAYLAAKGGLDHYFALPKAKRSAWLHSKDPRAAKVRAYFDKYGSKHLTPKARAYLAAKDAIDHYFALPKGKRADWLHSDDPRAKRVLHYFDKFGAKGHLTAKAKDYLAHRSALDYYFALDPKSRRDWLNGNSPMARSLRDYFARHGSGGVTQPRVPSQKFADYVSARLGLAYYFSLPAEERSRWLRGGGPWQQRVRAYFDKYGSPSGKTQTQHARDYLDAKDALDKYYAMPPDIRRSWLNSDDEDAKRVRDYFARYANGGIHSEASDYTDAKSALDHYFSLSADSRRAWLSGDSADAAKVRAYFKRYGSTHRVARSAAHPKAQAAVQAITDPVLRDRLDFWRQYFALTPDRRPAFVAQQAEPHGVFVYGVLGARERGELDANWYQHGPIYAAGTGAGGYLAVKPLLDLYFSLTDPAERELFRRANPEVMAYLATHQGGPVTGDPALDEALQHYFSLPQGSPQRSAFLRMHPEVQQYFDSKADPETAAMRRLLNVYFSLSGTAEKRDFRLAHPEISEYFNARRAARGQAKRQADAFTYADPRLRPYLKAAEFDVVGAQTRMREKLAFTREHRQRALERRDGRRPAKRPT